MGIRLGTVASFVVAFVYGGVILANTAPDLPPAGEDRPLFGNRSAAEFFAARAQMTECRQGLTPLRERFRRLRRELLQLRATGAGAALIDAKEREADAAREALYAPMEICGECASNPLEVRKVAGASGQEVWYIADGSCLSPNPSGYAAGREAVRKSPVSTRRFAGFPALLEFILVDGESGELKKDQTTIEGSPFNAYIAMRGVKVLGSMIAYAQYFGARWLEEKQGGVSTTYATFRSEKPPRDFVEPSIVDITAGGTELPTQLLPIDKMGRVISMWYLTDAGYIRYFTAGDFRADVPFLAREGRRAMQGTIVEMSERFAEAP